jgi:hypothetical protein
MFKMGCKIYADANIGATNIGSTWVERVSIRAKGIL